MAWGYWYQWSLRGRKLVQTLNYANAFAFMLYGWDAGMISPRLEIQSFECMSDKISKIGVMSSVLANPYFLKAIGNPTDSRLSTFIASGLFLGDVIGLAVIAPLSWRLGRRTTVIICCWIGIIGVLLQTTAYS